MKKDKKLKENEKSKNILKMEKSKTKWKEW